MRKKEMLKEMLVCCKVYISESRNKAALDAIERSVKIFNEAKIVNKFVDETYNRVGYTLVSKLPPEISANSCFLNEAALAMVASALKTIDFGSHSGSHPRLGVVDHICFHPLANASLEQTSRIARSLASDIGDLLADNLKCYFKLTIFTRILMNGVTPIPRPTRRTSYLRSEKLTFTRNRCLTSLYKYSVKFLCPITKLADVDADEVIPRRRRD
ncbi:hypothetical protein RND81_10G069300 [Saponaria officinalis]|uniref:Formiminotransferase N-terminal subdomain domain-containing protein n=1 Tax=Saponaria officinalis TaxID=3572 RepID=A0AAW1I1H1_SAPOF